MASLEEGRQSIGENIRVSRLYDETQYKPLYQERNSWVRPLLQRLGETEWGRNRFVIELKVDPSEVEEEHGWIVRKLAKNYHYQIGICSVESEGESKLGFFIKTGGEMVISKDLSEESLQDAISEALKRGPTHLEPPGRKRR